MSSFCGAQVRRTEPAEWISRLQEPILGAQTIFERHSSPFIELAVTLG